MDITGTVISVLPEQRFNGKNGEVVKNTFVIEHGGQYKKKAVFGVFGEERWQQMAITEGADVQVSFDIDAREWNGKWFGELTAWRVQAVGAAQASSPTPQRGVPQDGTHVENDSDLPF